MNRNGILCGTFICVDRNRRISHWPAEETVAEILEEDRDGGGPAYNAAVDLARLGAPFPVHSAAMVGDDEHGAFLRQRLEGAGVDVSHLRIHPQAHTSSTDAMASAETGRRTFFHDQGANAVFTPDDLDLERCGAAILHLGLLGLQRVLDVAWEDDANGWVTVLKRARERGVATNIELVSVDVRRIAELARPCLPHLDSLIVNDVEIGAVAGMETVRNGRTDVAACRRAARWALEAGVRQLVAVHFPAGAVSISAGGEETEMPSVRVPKEEIAGSNGAGDAFAAGMLIGMHEDWPLDDRMRLAHAAAAANLTALSTTGGLRSMDDCLKLADHWGWRESLEETA